MTSPTEPMPEFDEAISRINSALAIMLDAKRFNTVPPSVKPNELEGVIQGLQFAKALILQGAKPA